jgi:hypothetical protein
MDIDDLMINTFDGTIHFNKEKLINTSDYFKILLNGSFKEKGSNEITLEDPWIFVKLLLDMVCGMNILERSNVKYILHLADRYLFNDIKAKCEKFLIDHFVTFDINKFVKLAYDYKLESVKKHLRLHNKLDGIFEKSLSSTNIKSFPLEALELVPIHHKLNFVAKIIDDYDNKKILIEIIEKLLERHIPGDQSIYSSNHTLFHCSDGTLMKIYKYVKNETIEKIITYRQQSALIGLYSSPTFLSNCISSNEAMAGSISYGISYDTINGRKERINIILKDKYDFLNNVHRLVQGTYQYPRLFDDCRALGKIEIIGDIDISALVIFVVRYKDKMHVVSDVKTQYNNNCECDVLGSNKGIIIKCSGMKQRLCGNFNLTVIYES